MKTISTVFFLEAVAGALYPVAAPRFWGTLPMSLPLRRLSQPCCCSSLPCALHRSHFGRSLFTWPSPASICCVLTWSFKKSSCFHSRSCKKQSSAAVSLAAGQQARGSARGRLCDSHRAPREKPKCKLERDDTKGSVGRMEMSCQKKLELEAVLFATRNPIARQKSGGTQIVPNLLVEQIIFIATINGKGSTSRAVGEYQGLSLWKRQRPRAA